MQLAQLLTQAYAQRSAEWSVEDRVAAGRAYLYPRDWFASEADQRRILDALAPA